MGKNTNSSNDICHYAMEAIKSDAAQEVLKLSLNQLNLPDDTIEDYLKLFLQIVNENLEESTNDELLSNFRALISNNEFQYIYESIIKKIKFKDLSIEGAKKLKDLLNIYRINYSLEKLIIKAKLLNLLKQGKDISNGFELKGLSHFNKRKYTEIDGKIYEKLNENIVKSTLEEQAKIYIITDGKLEEIKGFESPEEITEAKTEIEGWGDIVVFYEGADGFQMIRSLYSINNKKILNLSGIRIELVKEGNNQKFDRKGRIFLQANNKDMLIDLKNMDLIGYAILYSFDFDGSEYFVSKVFKGLRIFSKDKNKSFEIEGAEKLSNIKIDEKTGIIKYGGKKWIGSWKNTIRL